MPMSFKIWVKYGDGQSAKVLFSGGDVDDLKKTIKDELKINLNINQIILRKYGEEADLSPDLTVDKSFVNKPETPIIIIDGSQKDVTYEEIHKQDWKWPCYDVVLENRRWTRKLRGESVQKKQDDIIPFRVIYNTSGFCTVLIELSSQPLISILRKILPNNSDLNSNAPNVRAKDLYHVMEIMKKERNYSLLEAAYNSPSEFVTEDGKMQIHLNHLIRFLEQEYSQAPKIHDAMLEELAVSFNMLWTFYVPNLEVWYRCAKSGQPVGGIISSIKESVECGGILVYAITISVVNYDGHGFKRGCVTRKIIEYEGEKNFSELPVVPFGLYKSHAFLKETMVDNGKRFFELAKGTHFMDYSGLLYWDSGDTVERVRSDGRVMIDHSSFVTMNPNYRMGNATPPSKSDIELLEKNYFKDQQSQAANHYLAPALVYGFSFALKRWGQFEVLNFSKIHFDTEAFDHLVMSQNKKDILIGLVKQYSQKHNGDEPDKLVKDITPLVNPLDPIRNKGEGCIFLCYGPPGTGKTLTAESVAEFLKVPLWMISVHELGMNPDDMERRLIKILDIAFAWKAVILLDEADIYLEKRSSVDLNRNAMTSVFLRQLEYYRGILFLTTNRVVTFDDAFCSRINMFFHYPKLSLIERHKVWTNFIRRASLPLKADDFAEYDLNGREIRNVIHTTQLLAKSKGEVITTDHVVNVIKIVLGFQDEMKHKLIENGY